MIPNSFTQRGVRVIDLRVIPSLTCDKFFLLRIIWNSSTDYDVQQEQSMCNERCLFISEQYVSVVQNVCGIADDKA